MKEITAIIRPNKVEDTKKALEAIGFAGFTGRSVYGRGKKSVDLVLSDKTTVKTDMVHKRMMIIAAQDKDVQMIIDTIINVNRTGNPGDGKIFVVPIETTYRVSTGEKTVTL